MELKDGQHLDDSDFDPEEDGGQKLFKPRTKQSGTKRRKANYGTSTFDKTNTVKGKGKLVGDIKLENPNFIDDEMMVDARPIIDLNDAELDLGTSNETKRHLESTIGSVLDRKGNS